MEAQEQIQGEQAFHDRQAEARAVWLRKHPRRLIVREDDYLDHEPWIRPALSRLGDLRGRRVLDFGCGHGMASVVLAKRGARVTAFDLSGGYVSEASARARANQVTVDFVQAAGACLPFASESFHCVWGNAILHHLDVSRAGRELWRVLKPEGLAVFCEPWGGNPMLSWARRHLPYPGKNRTAEEMPLVSTNVDDLRNIFPRVEVTGFQLFSMVGRVLGRRAFVKALASWDDRILARLAFLQRWCRYVVVTLAKSVPTRSELNKKPTGSRLWA